MLILWMILDMVEESKREKAKLAADVTENSSDSNCGNGEENE